MTPQSTHWDTLTARDIMRTEILTVPVDAPLSEVERLLGEYRIGGLPVTGEAGRIIGVVSMRDLIERYAQDPDVHMRATAGFRAATGFYHPASDEDVEGLREFSFGDDAADTSGDTAGDIMTPHVFTVRANAFIEEIAARMVEHNVHRILVTEDGRKIGFISTMDILKALAGQAD